MHARIQQHHMDTLDDPTLGVSKRGRTLLCDPLLNKGTGFPDSERDTLGLRGLVPPQVVSIDDQVQRVMENYRRKEHDLERYIHLETLHDRNETLYYRVLLEHIRELTPIVYTPVVGQACRHFGHIYRRARGMYFSASDVVRFPEMMHNWPEDDVDIIVVTDGSRILGLGDLGANGMGIPIGKLSLYVAGAGIYPGKTLPALLDVGTDNSELRLDPLYLGERHKRLDDDDYYAVVDAFIQAAHARWPKALIQFEDFSNNHAFPLLARYRDKVLCFNDDIQGTGAVTLAGIFSALRATAGRLSEQRILFMGAGAAARGIADMIVTGMMVQGGLDQQQARHQVWMFDSNGLVTRDRLSGLAGHKRDFAHVAPLIGTLHETVAHVRPTILIGVSGQPGSFGEDVIREMCLHVKRPIIFPLSNPTSKAECTAEQAYAWSEGAALFASGSPFPPVLREGHLYTPGQCNNMYIFPGVGMGAVSFGLKHISNHMFYAAAQALAEQVDDEDLVNGKLFPGLDRIRDISSQVAAAVGTVGFKQGLTDMQRPHDLLKYIHGCMFYPHYVPYVPV